MTTPPTPHDLYIKKIYPLNRMNNVGYYNNNNNSFSILLVLIAFMIMSSMSSSSVLLMYNLARDTIKPSAETQMYIDTQDQKLEKLAKESGIDLKELKDEIATEYKKLCLIPQTNGKCPQGTHAIANNCCEFDDPAVRSKFSKTVDITSKVLEVVIVSFLAEKIILASGRLALNLVSKSAATRFAAQVSARLAKKGLVKATVGIGTRLQAKFAVATSCGPLCIAVIIATEAFSLALDLTDPFGFNNFQANEVLRHQRNYIDVEMQRQLGVANYPMTFPLSIAFPGYEEELQQKLLSEFMPDAFKLMDDEMIVKFLVKTLSESKEDPVESEKIEKAFEMAINKAMENTQKRDNIIYEFYAAKGKSKEIERVPFLATKDRIGVTLSKYGAEQYNERMRSKHLEYSNPFKSAPGKIPEDYSPFVAMYTDTYRVVNATNPGDKHKPNVVDKKLSKKICLAMPYGGLIANCEYGMKSSKHNQRLNPSTYGVKYNYDRGDCDFTGEYCRRVGLDFKDNDCKMNTAQKYAEMIFGTTITRSYKVDWQNRIDAWKSGDPGKIAMATAMTLIPGVSPWIGKLISAIKDTYGRGVGTVPTRCGPDKEKKGALCYPKCREGYKSSALECEGTCPPGSKNTGLTCLQGIHSYIPSNRCANPFKKCFYQRKPCREGYRYRGSTCNRECLPGFKFRSGAAGSSFCDKPRNRYSRAGKPAPLDCPEGKVKDAGLCYTPCKEGYTGNGPTCKKIEESKQVNIYDV